MTPRERTLAALEHREPDRVPVDFGGHRSSGIAAIAYPKLRKCLGLPPRPVRVYDVIQQLAVIDEDVLDRFGIDVIEMGRGFALDDADWRPWVLPDGTACLVPAWIRPQREGNAWVLRSASGRVVGKMPDGALYFEQCHWPLMGSEGPWDIPAALGECIWTAVAAPPGPLDADTLAAGAQRLRQRSERAIVALFGGNLLEIGQMLFRNDHFLMMLAGAPERVHAFLDQLVEIHLRNLERFLAAVGPYVDIVLFGDDLGMQSGPQMSPAMYREFFQPRHARLWQRAKELARVKVLLHSCGGIRELLPDLIRAGLDAVNPVQITCRGMDAAELKRDFGGRLTFWGGGCDTRAVLPQSSPREVRAHVKRQVEILRPGGGFVFQQVHNVMADVPPQNVVAMFDAVAECNGRRP
ncbi:MAG: uroporphyrinogen decarboxylase family protein [Thermoguttaceae bacterium]|jgi:uroporphyrinogen decarboxylase